MISIDNLSIQANAAMGSKVGALAVFNSAGVQIAATFDIRWEDSGLFGISGGNLVSQWGAPIPPGFYAAQLFAIQGTTLIDEAWFSVNVTPVPNTNFVTSFTPGGSRNDFPGSVGMKITVGAKSLNVAALGRWVLSGNSQTHTVKLVAVSSGLDLPGGSVTIATAGKPAGAFAYANLAAPVTLSAGQSYYLVSSETAGGDLWYDDSSVVTSTAAASVTASVYNPGSGYVPNQGAGHAYVPVDFTYVVGP